MQNESSFDDWEDEITTVIESQFQTTRSDAQAIVEVHAFTLSQCWAKGMNAEDTALKIIADVRSTS
jgi:hypothetical protein